MWEEMRGGVGRCMCGEAEEMGRFGGNYRKVTGRVERGWLGMAMREGVRGRCI